MYSEDDPFLWMTATDCGSLKPVRYRKFGSWWNSYVTTPDLYFVSAEARIATPSGGRLAASLARRSAYSCAVMPGVTIASGEHRCNNNGQLRGTHSPLDVAGGDESHEQAGQIGDPRQIQRQWHRSSGLGLLCEPALMHCNEHILTAKKRQLVVIAGIPTAWASY